MSFNKTLRLRIPSPVLLMAMICLTITAQSLFAQRNLKNIPNPDPELERKTFIVDEGFEVSLFAADPKIAKPIQMNFDAKGRLWIAGSSVYPQIKPGAKANDKILVLEDTNGDGKADKTTVFADGLLIPTGIVPGDGGVYVANSTELIHLSDTNGDGKADKKRVVLSGFGTEDTHHILHTLRWGHDGMLYFNQSIYIHSHIETPHGVRRLDAGGIWHFRPETMQLGILMRGLVNSWGHHFDHWGQSFATDGAGGEGINYTFPGAVHVTAKGARRVVRGLNPGSPKHCGLEILSGRHLPKSWRGTMITNDFRAHRVCRFKVTEDQSGYASKQLNELIKTKHLAFRPIDVKMGPDGAIYIADWYNPIIQHGEVDFRDPRRDHTHGRIWRITAKGRPLVKPPKIVDGKIPNLLDAMKLPEEWTRLHAKLQLKSRGAKAVIPHLKKWLAKLDPKEKEYEHQRLEALWLYQGLNVVEPELLVTLLHSSDHRVRAAATRVLYHWHKRVPGVLDLLREQITDKHPRVRLEALRALSVVKKPISAELAMLAYDMPRDRFIDFALWQTMNDLKTVWLPALTNGKLDFGGKAHHLGYALQAVDSPQVVGPLLTLLQTGKLSIDRNASVLQLIISLGKPQHLNHIYQMTFSDKLSANQKAAILRSLATATRQRKIRPAGDLSKIVTLLASDNPKIQAAAAKLSGLWKVVTAEKGLIELAGNKAKESDVRRAAMLGLASLGSKDSRQSLISLSSSKQPFKIRVLAVTAIANLDINLAANIAVEIFRTAKSENNPSQLVENIINRKQGAVRLTAALKNQKISIDVAKLMVRAVRNSVIPRPTLEQAIRTSGKLANPIRKLTAKELAQLVGQVNASGDAARGEKIYRQKAMNCMNCHAIGGAGGRVGPDLVSIGASAQVDYLIESILQPSKKIKENYHSLVIENDEGEIITGVKIGEDKKQFVLRDINDKVVIVPKSTIEEKKDGGSLMPEGLVDSLTRKELVDLVRFLSELGKVGPYAIGKQQFVRRWQMLVPTDEVAKKIRKQSIAAITTPNSQLLWQSLYSEVSGKLPLSAIEKIKLNDQSVGVVRFSLNVTTAGEVRLKFNSTAGLMLWIDGKPQKLKETVDLRLKQGSHKLLLIINSTARKNKSLSCQLLETPGSKARAAIVNGK